MDEGNDKDAAIHKLTARETRSSNSPRSYPQSRRSGNWQSLFTVCTRRVPPDGFCQFMGWSPSLTVRPEQEKTSACSSKCSSFHFCDPAFSPTYCAQLNPTLCLTMQTTVLGTWPSLTQQATIRATWSSLTRGTRPTSKASVLPTLRPLQCGWPRAKCCVDVCLCPHRRTPNAGRKAMFHVPESGEEGEFQLDRALGLLSLIHTTVHPFFFFCAG